MVRSGSNSWGGRERRPSFARRGPAGAFSLIEVLIVVAMLAMLLAILLPSVSRAREQSRRAVCLASLHQLGLLTMMYSQDQRGWLVGSPNTSGNGARPGFAAGAYTATANPNHYPALQVFDWASPLLPLSGKRAPTDFRERYRSAVEDLPRCPSNRRRAGPGMLVYAPEDARAPSYATSRYFLYASETQSDGDVAGCLWFDEDCVPSAYVPKLERIKRPSDKAWLADGHVVSTTSGQIVNANYGFTSHGAWRKLSTDGPMNYRGAFLRREMWRHLNGINILTFDAHVEWQRNVEDADGTARPRDGLGEGARSATWWFPSGTQTASLPSRSAGGEPDLVVP